MMTPPSKYQTVKRSVDRRALRGDHRISFWVSPEEYDKLLELKLNEHDTISDVMRRLIDPTYNPDDNNEE